MCDKKKRRKNRLVSVIPYSLYTGKIAAGGIWASKSGKTPPAVAELLPDVTPT